MLQLTRKVGERIHIGDDVEIVVVSASRSEVRLGIQAPRSTSILRGEIVDRVAKENAQAAASARTQLASARGLARTRRGPKDDVPS